MTTQAGNWVAESCSTLGTGDIILTGAATGQAGFSGAISAGAVFYSIEDGTSREAGIGTFDGASTIVRGDIRATLVNGNYTKVSPLPISLTGSSVVSCTYNASAYEDVVQSANAAAASAVAAAASAAAALVSENAAAADLVLTNADAAATAADALSTAADVILTTADSVATALDVLATSADLVLTNADVVLTNADVASTNADVVLTTADVVSSAASAAAALVSENAAAASAATIPTYDPLTGEALNFVRLKAGETTMEFRTPAEVLSDVGAEAADATILKDADLGVTVQGYDADTTKNDVANTFTLAQTFDSGVVIGDWTVTEVTGNLIFSVSSVAKMKLDATGNLTVVGDVSAFGTL